MFAALAGCARAHLRPDPPAIPPAFAGSAGTDWNGGRVQSIAISPMDPKRTLVAMEFGGLWGTNNGGDNWFRIFSLPAVMVNDVEFGADGNTVIATVFRDNQVANGGGIYVSRDRGGSWTRPPTGAVPATSFFPRTSAYGLSRAPDEQRLWYAGTDTGVAVSTDDGGSWTHHGIDPNSTGIPVQGVLAFPRGQVLALTKYGLYRSNDRGLTWRRVHADTFKDWFEYGIHKMDRSPDHPWAFILKNYGGAGGTLYFYELDTDRITPLTTPQGVSRGPFVRVTRETGPEFGPWPIKVWIGHGWDGYFVVRTTADEFRALTKADWTSYIATAGIHADMSDLGVSAFLRPVLLGSDGGLFKLRPPGSPGNGDWVSAAVPGSGMNSLQITDLAGTNVRRPDGFVLSTSLYFGTQDNYLWASPDGGKTWPRSDGGEGYQLEVQQDARPGEPVTVAYAEIGGNSTEQFADANFLNQRAIPDVDQNGQPLDSREMNQAFYLERSPGGIGSNWLRLRTLPVPTNGVYVSTNSGSNWRRRFNLNFEWVGSVQRTNVGGGPVIQGAAGRFDRDTGARIFRQGVMAWLPVYVGYERIGLVLLSNLYANRIDTVDDSDAIRLPGNGSLGRRAAQWDWHAIFGADPTDWRFVIAPDVIAGDVKVTRDGGQTWTTDQRLTQQVLKGGQLMMFDDENHIQVTHIAFDPYREGRILVGTRDAGVICTIDNGRTWRTITNSERINVVTGFHFYPDGAAHIASWGHGLWYLDRTSGCSKTDPPYWRDRFPTETASEPGGVLARTIDEPPPPRGIADPSIAKLFVASAFPSSGVAGLGPDHKLDVRGRSFAAGHEVALRLRMRDRADPSAKPEVLKRVQIGKDGTFSTDLQFPTDLAYGKHTIEAVDATDGKVLAASDFVKSYVDEERERGSPR
jgi:photosystem II stability/assembly factor-like uncharacterized protein